ncbi:PAS-domain containing protein [Ramlibacter albus]|uniref:Virulence sensor protein BvgS n=1 Tax=Ramlibacter albus TaxID=2079448 RepID=A0A923MA71_9BURK|nr:PAS-domain containing protein [Ramlibacter albus]MBC5765594.1 PAS-domain containing protein [Ramlibacter albus]
MENESPPPRPLAGGNGDMLTRAEEMAKVGGWVTDLADRTLAWTPGMHAIHGVPADYKPSFNEHRRFFDDASNAQIDRAADAAVKEGKGWDLQLPMRRPDGSQVWVRSVGHVEWQEGRVRRLVGTLQDITELHEREVKLAAANELLHSVVDNLPCGLSVFDESLRLLVDNAEFRRLLGLPPSLFADGAVDFQRIIRFNADRGEYGPDADAAFESIVARAAAPVPHAFHRTRPNGTVLDIRGAPLPRGGFVTTYMDVTAESRMREALRRSEERQARALDASRVVLWDYDAAADVLYLSERWSELMGEPRAPTVTSMSALVARIPQEEREAVRAAWFAALRGTAGQFTSEHRVVAASGNEVWFMVQGRVVERDTGGRALRVTGTNTDITRRKAMESALEAAKAAAERSNRAKSDFVATISHEMRTPLHGVLTLLRLIPAQHDPAVAARYAGLAESSAQAMLKLIDELLDDSKLEAGKLQIAAAQFDQEAMLDELGAVFRERAREKDLEFVVQRGAGVPGYVRLDGFRLRQILQNLLANAIKFTGSGSITLAVSCEADGMLAYEVRDTGIGMSEGALARLFDRFHQADAATAARFGGTGLGLAISKELAQLMGGDITVTSEEAVGTRFLLRVPFEPCDAPRHGFAPTAAPVAQPMYRRDGRVVVVDDNELNRLVACELLKRLGVKEVDTATDGHAGVELVLARRPDLVLMDCQMPGLDGYEAAARLRQSGYDGGIVAFTAGQGEAELARCRAAGMDATLGKPVDVQTLRAVLDQWLVRDAQRTELDFNRAAFEDRFASDRDLGRMALVIFVETGASDIRALLEEAQRGDRQAIHRISHKLAGSAGTVAADRVWKLSTWLEAFAAEAAIDELGQAAQKLRDAFDRFAGAAQAELARRGQGDR